MAGGDAGAGARAHGYEVADGCGCSLGDHLLLSGEVLPPGSSPIYARAMLSSNARMPRTINTGQFCVVMRPLPAATVHDEHAPSGRIGCVDGEDYDERAPCERNLCGYSLAAV